MNYFMVDGRLADLLQSHPLPYAIVFAQYGMFIVFLSSMRPTYSAAGLWRRLARHYHPIRLGKRLLQGQVLDTFPQASTDPPLGHRRY